ncbi:type II methionyl aminopeptidase [Candidatus Pacearchaeota archaeon]|nr:type II methionyl aminopeptidase [Candidatus Pacearchaeota archaeon]
MKQEEKQKILKAGEIASQIREYVKSIVKKDILLLELAEKIESKIIELGGKPAFPVNLSINDIAAHYTPSYDDKTLAHGLLKVDFGVHIDGYIADTALSFDLENNEENKKLIQAAESALKNALGKVRLNKSKTTTSQIGIEISKTIENNGFSPIINLSGHSIEQYELHSGTTIPNIDDNRNLSLNQGLYAIEPFATTGSGKVYDGKYSGIYKLEQEKNTRLPTARKILEYIKEEYQTLPFCSRWIIKKFGPASLLSLKQLQQQGIIHEFAQLVEYSHKPVSQAEHTILIDEKEVIVTTG